MNINKTIVLHDDDKDTNFQAATVIKRESSEIIWKVSLSSLVAPYIGYPNAVILDQSAQFYSTNFLDFLLQ